MFNKLKNCKISPILQRIKQIHYETIGLLKHQWHSFFLPAKLLPYYIEGFITLKQINTMKTWAGLLRPLP